MMRYEVFFNGSWKPASEEAYYCSSEGNRRFAERAEELLWSYECAQPGTDGNVWCEFYSREKPAGRPGTRNIRCWHAVNGEQVGDFSAPAMMSRGDVIELLRSSLRLEVKTTSEYTGGMADGQLYTNCHTLTLTLDGEAISEISL